jgi:hypothetical protein
MVCCGVICCGIAATAELVSPEVLVAAANCERISWMAWRTRAIDWAMPANPCAAECWAMFSAVASAAAAGLGGYADAGGDRLQFGVQAVGYRHDPPAQ